VDRAAYDDETRVRLEEALKESEQRFERLVEAAKDYAIFMLDAEGRVTTWNEGAERVFGYEEEEILGKDACVLFTPEDRTSGRPEREMETARTEGRAEDERWHVRKDGSRFWANGHIIALRGESDQPIGFLKIIQDRTEAKQAMDELQRTIRFWTREGLLPPRGGPNRLALYEPEMVHRCVFIRRLRTEQQLNLEHIRRVLDTVDAPTIRRVATGKEPLRIATAKTREEAASYIVEDEKVIELSQHIGSRPSAKFSSKSEFEDRPQRLQRLSDDEKCAAIAEALHELTGSEFRVALTSIDYEGSAWRIPFGAPAKLDCEIEPVAPNPDAAESLRRLKQTPDAELCDQIFSALQRRCDETYRAEVGRKYYSDGNFRQKTPACGTRWVLRLSLFIARSD
jgi:PAS domain S-box-containing protein